MFYKFFLTWLLGRWEECFQFVSKVSKLQHVNPRSLAASVVSLRSPAKCLKAYGLLPMWMLGRFDFQFLQVWNRGSRQLGLNKSLKEKVQWGYVRWAWGPRYRSALYVHLLRAVLCSLALSLSCFLTPSQSLKYHYFNLNNNSYTKDFSDKSITNADGFTKWPFISNGPNGH